MVEVFDAGHQRGHQRKERRCQRPYHPSPSLSRRHRMYPRPGQPTPTPAAAGALSSTSAGCSALGRAARRSYRPRAGSAWGRHRRRCPGPDGPADASRVTPSITTDGSRTTASNPFWRKAHSASGARIPAWQVHVSSFGRERTLFVTTVGGAGTKPSPSRSLGQVIASAARMKAS